MLDAVANQDMDGLAGSALSRATDLLGWLALGLLLAALALKSGWQPVGLDRLIWIPQLNSVMSRLVRTIATFDSKLGLAIVTYIAGFVLVLLRKFTPPAPASHPRSRWLHQDALLKQPFARPTQTDRAVAS